MHRPTRLNDLTPMEASAAINDFIPEGKSGDWEIRKFTVDEEKGAFDFLRSFGDGGGRYTPPGEYLSLLNTNEDVEFVTMMSNTPDELADHEEFIEAASGRVLVTGLGLSCVVSGLLANPYVNQIDVIEADADIIKLVGPAYEAEDRVTIHHARAEEWDIPADASWAFAWHDIWAFIADYNLDDERAENGVSYRRLFQKYAPHVSLQQAWAFDLALCMRKCDELAQAESDELSRRWREADEDGRMDILREWHGRPNPVLSAIDRINGGEAPPEKPAEVIEFMLKTTNAEEAVKVPEQKFWIDSQPLLPGVKASYSSLLIEEELLDYGLDVTEHGFACEMRVPILNRED